MGYSSIAKTLRNQLGIPERQFAEQAGLSRSNLRKLESGSTDIRLESLRLLAKELGRKLDISLSPNTPVDPSQSVLYASLLIEQDGFDSWKIHLMNFVDGFRRNYDLRLFVLPPLKTVDKRIYALIASVVLQLCDEVGSQAPPWAKESHYLDKPWFVSEMQSLKASALLESTWHYRKNNIFVLENFLLRV